MRVSRRSQRWAVLISGRGSNLQALLDHAPELDLRWVLTSRPEAAGILRARRAGVACELLPRKIDWMKLDSELRRRGITHLFLAGFMKIIPSEFVEKWAGKMLNVHPSLLPDYPGLNAMEKSFADGAAMGVTVHVVTPEMDAGPRLLQQTALCASKSRASSDESGARFKMAMTEHRLVREAALKWN